MAKQKVLIKLKSYLKMRYIIGVSIGLLTGFFYYHFVGCSTGGCAITSNPWLTIGWGAIMGFLIVDSFPDRKGAAQNADLNEKTS